MVRGYKGLLVLLAISSYGCDSGFHDFALPEGDPDNGLETFLALGCTSCHSAEGAPHNTEAGTELHVPLGGEVRRQRTYTYLVTSIINPSHRAAKRTLVETVTVVDGEEVSKMPFFNDIMTVQQLTDLVTFLSPQYKVVIPYIQYHDYDYGDYDFIIRGHPLLNQGRNLNKKPGRNFP